MALVSNQTLTETSTRDFLWGLRRPVHWADNLVALCDDCQKSWESRPPGVLGVYPGMYRDGLTYLEHRHLT